MNKKGQGSGFVTAMVIGVAGIVIAFAVAFIVVSTLLSSESILSSTANTVTNETNAWANGNGTVNYTVDNSNPAGLNARTFTLTDVWTTNQTDTAGGYNVQWANFSTYFILDGTTGILANISGFNNTLQANMSISYTYLTDGDVEGSANRMSDNFSAGADNVSEQIPTLLLIAAIVLILSIIAILVVVWSKFRFGGGSL